MKLEREDFVSWLEGGGFDLADFRREVVNGRPWSICEGCVMAKFAQSTCRDESVATGNEYFSGKLTPRTMLPKWAQAVVREFDDNYLMWNQEQMVRELVAVARHSS